MSTRFPTLLINRIYAEAGATPQKIFGGNLKHLVQIGSTGNPFEFGVDQLSPFQATILNSDRVGGLIDRTALTFDEVSYESDFTTDIDGWNALNVTLDFNQTVGGEAGWLKLTCINGNAQHYATKTALNYGKNYKLTYKWYIPSSNTNIDSLYLIGHGGNWYTPEPVLSQQGRLDQINTFEGNINTNANNAMRFQQLDNGATTNDSNGDVIYIKDVKAEQRSGTGFGQATNNAWPTWDSVERTWDTDGVSDHLYDNVTFAQVNGGDLSGTFYFDLRDDEGTGVVSVMFAVANAVTSASERFHIYFDGNDKLVLTTTTSSSATIHTFPNTVTRDTKSIITLKSNGTGYTAYQDDTDLGTPTNNDGTWMGDLGTLTMASYGRRHSSTAIYDQWGYGSSLYVNVHSSLEQDIAIRSWINNI